MDFFIGFYFDFFIENIYWDFFFNYEFITGFIIDK